MSQAVTAYIRAGDASSTALLAYLDSRKVTYTVRDVGVDPAAQAVLFGRLGRVVAPVTQVGDVMVPGFDPLQLAGLLPSTAPVASGVNFGASVRTVSRETAKAAGLAGPFGVEVGPVRDGSPAQGAGIATGDVISAIGAYTLTGGREQFVTAIGARRPGDTITLAVTRSGVDMKVVVTFPHAEAPGDSPPNPEVADEASGQDPETAIDLDAAGAPRAPLASDAV